MIRLALILYLIAAFPLYAYDVIGEAEGEGKPILLFDDGFWRYDDEDGEICTPSGSHGEVCALPSIWSPLPHVDELRYGIPEFVQDEFIAEFRALTPMSDSPITIDNVLAFIGNQTFHDGLKATSIESTSGNIGNLTGGHIVVSAGRYGVFAFTYANQNGPFLIARTKDQNTTLYSNVHRQEHQSFVNALRPGQFE